MRYLIEFMHPTGTEILLDPVRSIDYPEIDGDWIIIKKLNGDRVYFNSSEMMIVGMKVVTIK